MMDIKKKDHIISLFSTIFNDNPPELEKLTEVFFLDEPTKNKQGAGENE